MDATIFDADYFLNGLASGKSLYSNYRWLRDLTVPMAARIADVLGLSKNDTILDFGCSRGYLVRAMRELGYEAFGYDISEWAIANCDQSVRPWLYRDIAACPAVNWIIAKDVLEHIQDVHAALKQIGALATCGVFIVVPLSAVDDEPYVIADYERDITHCIRWTLPTWMCEVNEALGDDWSVVGAYRIEGIKDNWHKSGWEHGNGFIIAKKTVG